MEQPDLDFRSALLNIRRSESKGFIALPKGGRPRKVDMTERLKKALLQYRHSQSSRVLWRDATNPREKDYPTVTEVSIRNWMEEVQKRAAVKDPRVLVTGNIHLLRHTFCSRLAMLGVPALTIKQLAGHTSMRTTLRYMHLSPTARSGGIKALDAAIEREQRQKQATNDPVMGPETLQ